jgi:hypothetical protein
MSNHDAPTACLIVFPSSTSSSDPCPRCGHDAGDHPAPMDLIDGQELPVAERPTMREVRLERRQDAERWAAWQDRHPESLPVLQRVSRWLSS